MGMGSTPGNILKVVQYQFAPEVISNLKESEVPPGTGT
jgi:hypothetical protein